MKTMYFVLIHKRTGYPKAVEKSVGILHLNLSIFDSMDNYKIRRHYLEVTE